MGVQTERYSRVFFKSKTSGLYPLSWCPEELEKKKYQGLGSTNDTQSPRPAFPGSYKPASQLGLALSSAPGFLLQNAEPESTLPPSGPGPSTLCTVALGGCPCHSPGRSRAGCIGTAYGQDRSRPRHRRPGRSVEPWQRGGGYPDRKAGRACEQKLPGPGQRNSQAGTRSGAGLNGAGAYWTY